VDLWIPKYNIGIEYQGAQHYNQNTYFGEGFSALVKRDRIKKTLGHLSIVQESNPMVITVLNFSI
jgi:hypothetical protein